MRYFSMDARPAIVAKKDSASSLAWVKNPGEDDWLQLEHAYEVEFDNSGRGHGRELAYEVWLDVFGDELAWTEVDEFTAETHPEDKEAEKDLSGAGKVRGYLAAGTIGALGGVWLLPAFFSADESAATIYLIIYAAIGAAGGLIFQRELLSSRK